MKILVYIWVRSNMPDESTKKLMRSVHFWVRSYLPVTVLSFFIFRIDISMLHIVSLVFVSLLLFF